MSKSEINFLRMFHWLLLAVLFYAAALLVTQPQIQTGLWKLGHITVGAFAGYWIDRNLFGRVSPDASGTRLLARAVVVAASILGMAFGL